MEHDAMVKVIDRLILSGLKEPEAVGLVTQLLFEEAEDFVAIVDELYKLEITEKLN